MRYAAWIASFTVCSTAFTATGLSPVRVGVRHIESGGVGYNTGYSTVEAFASSDMGMCPFVFFGDARGHIFNNGRWAANAGLGVRGLFWDRALGLNAYYDYRDAKHLIGNQWGIGLESLGTFVDLRVNGYLPFAKKVSESYDTRFDFFSGHQMYLSQKKKMALKGADAEVGFHFGRDSGFKYYGAVGPYYYTAPIGSAFWGARASLSASYKHYITLEIFDSYDRIFHNRVQGQLSFSIPLGRKKKGTSCKSCPTDNLACRKIQPVRRSEIIAMKHHTRHPVAINPATNTPYQFVFVNNLSSSDGTFESPYHSLSDAQDNSQPYDIIYVYPGDGTSRNMDSGITLQDQQKLWGTGVRQPLITTNGWVTVPVQSASLPTLSYPTGSTVILSQNNEVSGIAFGETGSSNSAIFGLSSNYALIQDCLFLYTCNNPISISSLGAGEDFAVTILNNSFSGCSNGIKATLSENTPSAEIAIRNNSFSNISSTIGLNTVHILGVNTNKIPYCNLIAQNNTFENAQNGGIGLTQGIFKTLSASISNNAITNSIGAGAFHFKLDADQCEIYASNNYASNNNGDGFFLESLSNGITTANINIKNNQFINSSDSSLGNGVSINTNGQSCTLTILNNNLSNNSGSGIVVYNAINNVDNFTINIGSNLIINNQNFDNYNAGSGISLDGFDNLIGSISYNILASNQNGTSLNNVIGYFTGNGASLPAPTGNLSLSIFKNTINDGLEIDWYGDQTACITIQNNTSSQDPAYTLNNYRTGTFHIAPTNYLDVNTGGFSLTGTIGTVSYCQSSNE